MKMGVYIATDKGLRFQDVGIWGVITALAWQSLTGNSRVEKAGNGENQ